MPVAVVREGGKQNLEQLFLKGTVVSKSVRKDVFKTFCSRKSPRNLCRNVLSCVCFVFPIVVTDGAMPGLIPAGTFISHIIHYELPTSRAAFTSRLTLLYPAIHRFSRDYTIKYCTSPSSHRIHAVIHCTLQIYERPSSCELTHI